jgi:hypothetical protein
MIHGQQNIKGIILVSLILSKWALQPSVGGPHQTASLSPQLMMMMMLSLLTAL